jgi:hypothetical protein
VAVEELVQGMRLRVAPIAEVLAEVHIAAAALAQLVVHIERAELGTEKAVGTADIVAGIAVKFAVLAEPAGHIELVEAVAIALEAVAVCFAVAPQQSVRDTVDSAIAVAEPQAVQLDGPVLELATGSGSLVAVLEAPVHRKYLNYMSELVLVLERRAQPIAADTVAVAPIAAAGTGEHLSC